MGGVYKLGAIRGKDGEWDFKVKLSEMLIKVSNPGLIQVRRYFKNGLPVADMLYNKEQEIKETQLMDPVNAGESSLLPDHDDSEDLLIPIFENGKCVYQSPKLSDIRERTLQQLADFPENVTTLGSPTEYPVGLEQNLYELKTSLIQKAKAQ